MSKIFYNIECTVYSVQCENLHKICVKHLNFEFVLPTATLEIFV